MPAKASLKKELPQHARAAVHEAVQNEEIFVCAAADRHDKTFDANCVRFRITAHAPVTITAIWPRCYGTVGAVKLIQERDGEDTVVAALEGEQPAVETDTRPLSIRPLVCDLQLKPTQSVSLRMEDLSSAYTVCFGRGKALRSSDKAISIDEVKYNGMFPGAKSAQNLRFSGVIQYVLHDTQPKAKPKLTGKRKRSEE
uniref:Uncharacterized protein n=1 Tax=Eutreptiella gymnastica TaxID=73025 RepID=A0A7S4FUL7_9EUGL|mmetsp:Transcript_8384/g.12782  ORF Transcript_8384/g.12782 Transcript_8384/m.12782 type:complete len:198 (-) Transcript_8384:1288-1881(-)